ncbi:hypothetical protein FT643_04550 [Ketobacter sp. MCCC 1A13808]|uniref:hypothetical protein n=1 Tax=Ketobacter sp. MCCC 1A13808 TaxID=2602738 RepID=UPI000F19D754|nr:hypothetical protein [Ketobacter sp. MCCC 1A13808]MVF11409.1 hypothetical protein [Ketobacter sp. MCCC 1A13808]RLP54652.1 MAG: hypothetical protein D6160_09590 [Ketobacter sp.]
MRKVTFFSFLLLLASASAWSASKYDSDKGAVGAPSEAAVIPHPNALFAPDRPHMSNEDASKLLFSKIRLVTRTNTAFLQLPNDRLGERYFGDRFERSEEYVDFQQKLKQTMRDSVLASDRVNRAVPLPDFFAADQLSLAQMREAALRLQVHLLVIFSVNSNVFTVGNAAGDNVKAYANCEIALLDTQSGLLPFTNSIMAKVQTAKLKSDVSDSGTSKRAEEDASVQCLQTLGKSAAAYLNSIPL